MKYVVLIEYHQPDRYDIFSYTIIANSKEEAIEVSCIKYEEYMGLLKKNNSSIYNNMIIDQFSKHSGEGHITWLDNGTLKQYSYAFSIIESPSAKSIIDNNKLKKKEK